jgi:hypothetical protein
MSAEVGKILQCKLIIALLSSCVNLRILIRETEVRGVVVSISASCFGGPRYRSGPETGYPNLLGVFVRVFQITTGELYVKLVHDCFLSYHFQFIIH